MRYLRDDVFRTSLRRSPALLCFVLLSAIFAHDLAAYQTGGGTRPKFQSALDSYLNKMADSGFAFSALVAVDGKILLQKGFGWRDTLRSNRTSDHTLFNVASITKSFTAIAIFKLREDHLLDLNDTLGQYFQDIPAEKRSITIAQLLAHSSGLPQNYSADGVTERDSAIAKILNDSLKFSPGTGFAYSNENYELLGAIIEIVSKKKYETFVGDNIFQPARMVDTKFWDVPAGTTALEIASMNRTLDPAVLKRNWGYIASGGIYSNVIDLCRWFTSLLGGRILAPESVRQMWALQRKASDTGIAFGWFVSDQIWGKEIWTRGTEDWGHNGVVRWFPDRKTLIILLSNSGERGKKNETANRFISDAIANIMFK